MPLMNSTVYMAFRLYSVSGLKFLYFMTSVNVSNHAMQRFTTNQNIVTLMWPTKSPDLVPIEHILDILGSNFRCNDVRTRPQIMTALRCEWAVISQNDIRISFV